MKLKERLNKPIKSNNQQAQSKKEKIKNPSEQNDFCSAKVQIFYPVRNVWRKFQDSKRKCFIFWKIVETLHELKQRWVGGVKTDTDVCEQLFGLQDSSFPHYFHILGAQLWSQSYSKYN